MEKPLWLTAIAAIFLATLTWADLGYAQYKGGESPKKQNLTKIAMLSKIPIKLDKVKKDDIDKQILRAAIIAELDAVNLYEQLASMTDDEKLRNNRLGLLNKIAGLFEHIADFSKIST